MAIMNEVGGGRGRGPPVTQLLQIHAHTHRKEVWSLLSLCLGGGTRHVRQRCTLSFLWSPATTAWNTAVYFYGLGSQFYPLERFTKDKTPKARPPTYCTYSQHSNTLSSKRFKPGGVIKVILRPWQWWFLVCWFLTLESKRRSCWLFFSLISE